MSEFDSAPSTETRHPFIALWSRRISITIFVAMIAWAPFPLGSAVDWGAPLLEVLIGFSWILWAISAVWNGEPLADNFRKIRMPALLVAAVLIWIFIQAIPSVRGLTPNPLWGMTSGLLQRPLMPMVSINPWHTYLAFLKIVSEVAAFWLAFCFASDSATARSLLHAVVIITSLYAFYGIVIAIIGTSQASLVYGIPLPAQYMSGPFMLHNSFATFCGMGLVTAVLCLIGSADRRIDTSRGVRRLGLTLIQFVFGRSARWLVACVVLFGALVASASRAGFAATIAALAAVGAVGVIRSRRSNSRLWALIGVAAVTVPFAVFIVGSGDTLAERLNELIDAGNADNVRIALWNASVRMIDVFPWTGLGLGTFEDAYPMFATSVLPYVMDKAHSDYLEFAAGVGMPAAAAWWVSMLWLVVQCLHGSLVRRRNVVFPLTAFGVSVLIGVHSAMDFSLQIPADALLYVSLLGVGVAQSQRTGASRNLSLNDN